MRMGAASLLGILIAAGSTGCIPPRSFKQVRNPQSGVPLNRRVCLVYSQRYQIHLAGFEKLHPFDINKYGRIYLEMLKDGFVTPEEVFVPEAISRDDLLRIHTPRYLDSLQDPAVLARALEFGPAALAPAGLTDAAVLRPFRHATGGTLLAARLALRYGMAVNLGGGFHHAGPDSGEGFCVYADMPVAIRTLQAEGAVRRALIVDLDAHQGNGTARCFAGDDAVFTFDIHQADIYPIPKETNDVDIAMERHVSDVDYLRVLSHRLPAVFEQAQPDIVFLQAGVDVLDGDPLADFRLTEEGIVARDSLVFAQAHRRGLPIVMVLGGGYSDRAWAAQYQSIRSLVRLYGLGRPEPRHPPRKATPQEKIYTK